MPVTLSWCLTVCVCVCYVTKTYTTIYTQQNCVSVRTLPIFYFSSGQLTPWQYFLYPIESKRSNFVKEQTSRKREKKEKIPQVAVNII